jgi:hypothetical protein
VFGEFLAHLGQTFSANVAGFVIDSPSSAVRLRAGTVHLEESVLLSAAARGSSSVLGFHETSLQPSLTFSFGTFCLHD